MVLNNDNLIIAVLLVMLTLIIIISLIGNTHQPGRNVLTSKVTTYNSQNAGIKSNTARISSPTSQNELSGLGTSQRYVVLRIIKIINDSHV